MRLASWVASLLVCILILAACGGDEEDTASPTATLAPEEAAVADLASGCWTEDQRSELTVDDLTYPQWSAPPRMVIARDQTYMALLETSEGLIEIELLAAEAPVTVNNFICLAAAGYYDETPFHRILEGFVIQGGDPTGSGTGGPGYRFNDEPVGLDYTAGTVAMANSGPNSNGSQFFIVLDDLQGQLPKQYTIFGRVAAGAEVVEAIAQTPTRPNARGEPSVPEEVVTIERVRVRQG